MWKGLRRLSTCVGTKVVLSPGGGSGLAEQNTDHGDGLRTRQDAETAFRAFVQEAEPRLRRALVATYGYERGREATAEALAYAWEHWERLRGFRNPTGYLYRVGQSRTRRNKSPVVFESVPLREPSVEPALKRAIAALPAKQRIAVFLAYGDEWTQAEVAELLGVTPATVQKHIERGLVRLREIVTPKELEED
jgi:DNA-directed RNA polymerase specialized sigma24 family protein